METTQYPLNKEGARRYFYDLEDMLEVYKDMEGIAMDLNISRHFTSGDTYTEEEVKDIIEVASVSSASTVSLTLMEHSIRVTQGIIERFDADEAVEEQEATEAEK
jgi:hypothetical protein|nr:MAG TPA: hypothetical protein [Caudoviricetes sp.]